MKLLLQNENTSPLQPNNIKALKILFKELKIKFAIQENPTTGLWEIDLDTDDIELEDVSELILTED